MEQGGQTLFDSAFINNLLRQSASFLNDIPPYNPRQIERLSNTVMPAGSNSGASNNQNHNLHHLQQATSSWRRHQHYSPYGYRGLNFYLKL